MLLTYLNRSGPFELGKGLVNGSCLAEQHSKVASSVHPWIDLKSQAPAKLPMRLDAVEERCAGW